MSLLSSETVHASCVAIGGRGLLIAGPSGVGKSDLALRLIDRGAQLVSDDYTIVWRADGRLRARAPANITGLIEVRGVGIVSREALDEAPLALAINLERRPERLPDTPETWPIAGLSLPVIGLSAHEASTTIKVELALDRYGLTA